MTVRSGSRVWDLTSVHVGLPVVHGPRSRSLGIRGPTRHVTPSGVGSWSSRPSVVLLVRGSRGKVIGETRSGHLRGLLCPSTCPGPCVPSFPQPSFYPGASPFRVRTPRGSGGLPGTSHPPRRPPRPSVKPNPHPTRSGVSSRFDYHGPRLAPRYPQNQRFPELVSLPQT